MSELDHISVFKKDYEEFADNQIEVAKYLRELKSKRERLKEIKTFIDSCVDAESDTTVPLTDTTASSTEPTEGTTEPTEGTTSDPISRQAAIDAVCQLH